MEQEGCKEREGDAEGDGVADEAREEEEEEEARAVVARRRRDDDEEEEVDETESEG